MVLNRPDRARRSLIQYAVAIIGAAGASGSTTSAVSAQDTVRVRSTTAPLWGPSVRLTLTKELGLADGPDEYSFGRIGAVVFDKPGRMYTYDEQDNRIRQYDATFKFIREIGRSGAGPGEYESVSNLTFIDDTVLVVKDHELARVSYFYPSGKLRGSMVHTGFAKVGFGDFTIDSDGFATFKDFRPDPALGSSKSPLDRMRYSQLKRVRPNGTVADSVQIPVALRSPSGKLTIGGHTNFHPETRFSVMRRGGFVVGDGAPYRFMIRPLTGPVRIVDRAWTPIALGKEERENWLEIASDMAARSKARPGTDGPETYEIPSAKPAIRDIFSDEDNRIWVSVFAPARKVTLPPRTGNSTSPRLAWRQLETYDVFTDKGDYLGRVQLPDGLSMGRAKGNRIWMTATGPSDEQTIRIYTMSGSAALK